MDITALHDERGAALDQVATATLRGLPWDESPGPKPAVDLTKALEDSIRRAQHDRRQPAPLDRGQPRARCWARHAVHASVLAHIVL
ncbi:hypothetical protein EEJ42_43215 [Streptomyces botrytidirepellens]|uniref:Uncharacterized protein n=1 Tax=Streptomyces botrytidirepellens TaxID=2486417 RepID=A0A3M8SWY9_9ACTN|nr:hypothetical protein EEJ42_43215 [Streptomyces botrytidirepellens]